MVLSGTACVMVYQGVGGCIYMSGVHATAWIENEPDIHKECSMTESTEILVVQSGI